ncbi:hypothetical protein KKG41_02080 [Patescibacteria group bacterium]|nr:hypothetical protein [Patescibacteria group bacterium]MBU1889896.1 hypothetical protein [Patescibacteria group bacterium]
MLIVKKITKVLLTISLLTLVATFWFRNTLPKPEQILPELNQEPNQIAVNMDPIRISQDGFTAILSPLYEYRQSGLVVTQYDSDTWYDYSHKNDPFNTKDVCVIWGHNIKTDTYRQGDFGHGEFTCTWYFNDGEMFNNFSYEAIANNHLIPANREVQKMIARIRIGDQISLSGYLVNYEVTDDTKQKAIGQRSTSTTRLDTGNGACEIIYVTELEILKANPGLLPLLYRLSLVFSVVFFVIRLLMLLRPAN